MKNLCQHFVTFLPVLVIIIIIFFLLHCLCPFVTCLLCPISLSLTVSLSLSPSHFLSSFNSWCTFCDIILNPAALFCIYISVCLGMQKLSYRLYLTLPYSLLPSFSFLGPVSRQSIQFFDTNSVELCCVCYCLSFVFAL